MSIYTHRPLVPAMSGRIPELLETIKNEYEALAQDLRHNQAQREEYEIKFHQQLSEMAQFQQTLHDLERNHTKIKQQYEDEIVRLRRELEIRSAGMTAQQGQAPNLGGNPMFPGGVGGLAPMEGYGFQNGSNKRVKTEGAPPIQAPPIQAPPSAQLPQLQSLGQPPTNPHASMQPGLQPLQPLQSIPNLQIPPGHPSHQQPPPLQQPPQPQQIPPPQAAAAHSLLHAQQAAQQQQPPPLQQPPPPLMQQPLQASPQQQQQQPLANPQTLPSLPPQIPPVQSLPSPPVSNPLAEGAEHKDKKSPASAKATSLGDVDIDSLPTHLKKEGSDWLVVFNKATAPNVDIDLGHNLEHTSVVCCVKFSFDSKYLATGCNRSTQVFDVITGAKVGEFSDSNSKDGDLYIRSVCFSPDGQYLATGAEDKQIRVWDIKKNKMKNLFSGHEQDIYSLDFSRDGQFVCSGSGDRTARIWSMETGKCVFVLGNDEAGPKDAGVTSVAISPDGRLVAAGSLDRIVRIWDAKSGRFLDKLEGHKDSVYSVSFSPDGKSLVSGSLDKTIKLWELGNHNQRSVCKLTFSGHKDFVLSVAFSPDGKWIISGSKDRTVQFWDPATGLVQCMLQGHKNSVISVAVSPSATHFATGSGDWKARIWKYNSTSTASAPSSTSIASLTNMPSISNLTNPASTLSNFASLAALAFSSTSNPTNSITNAPPSASTSSPTTLPSISSLPSPASVAASLSSSTASMNAGSHSPHLPPLQSIPPAATTTTTTTAANPTTAAASDNSQIDGAKLTREPSPSAAGKNNADSSNDTPANSKSEAENSASQTKLEENDNSKTAWEKEEAKPPSPGN